MARETRALPGRPSGYIPGSFRQLNLTPAPPRWGDFSESATSADTDNSSSAGWPERLEPYQGGDGPRDSSPTKVRMAVAQGGRWRRVQAGRPAGLVGMVSHRPLPGLPGEVGMARETRALPG